METIVSLKDVVKEYSTGEKTFRALDHVSLDIGKGKFVCILGPSGAGKSTLLNLIGGMDNPTSGSVVINGSDITGFNEDRLSDFRAENIGFIFQFYNILPSLTVLENVELVKEIVKNPLDADRALEAVGLIEHKNKYPSQLSGGEQQRVCVARALINYPEIILADEPTGNLDDKNEEIVVDLFHQLHAEGTTLIVVTHDPEVAEVAQRTVVLRHGKLEKEVINEHFTGTMKH